MSCRIETLPIQLVSSGMCEIESILCCTLLTQYLLAHCCSLTESGFSHATSVNAQTGTFVSVYSNLSTRYTMATFTVSLDYVDGLLAPPTVSKLFQLHSAIAAPAVPPFPIVAPKPFQTTSSTGDTLHGVWYAPPNYDATKRYPTILWVYGGPHVQV
jgi:dipeptidyl-peptidase 9